MPDNNNHAFKTIFYSGLVAGVLDILAAFLITIVVMGRSSVEKILQYIASAAIGPTAFKGGWQTALAGLLFHFLIAFVFAAIYYAAIRKIDFLWRQPFISGLLYGVLVWVIMNFAVIPLSTLKTQSMTADKGTILVFLANVFCVGLPIALICAKNYSTAVRKS
ncbi:MAG: DUF1440 domain-containing protein [Gemmatimonadaceae bacterium]|nr:DUF1440 domain-containing protein [Chitinophagaceae bacterium]